MNLLIDIGVRVGEALLQWLLSPFYWLSILLIALHYRRQVILERRLFAVKMHSWITHTWHAWLGGLIAGILVSFASIGLGVTLSREVIILLWMIALVLLLVRVRFLCLAYAASMLALIQFGLNIWGTAWNPEGWLGDAVASVRGMDAAGLLVLVALLHAAEAVLIRKQAAQMAGPMFIESKRGRVVGAYRMQSMWPVPLLLLFPASSDGAALPWTPLFGGDLWQQGWMLVAFPVVVGFSELTFTKLPQQKAALSSTRLFAYAALLLAVSLAAAWWPPLVPVAAIAALGMHEGLIWLSRREEAEHSPVFTQDAGGLRILAVLPKSPAAELGIVQGEVIVKVNGIKVRTKEELHQALRMNAAFCKLEVNNLAGEVRFLQRAIYAGDHHQLGVLLAPDDHVEYVAVTRALSLFSFLRVPWTRSKRGAKCKQQENVDSGSQSADKAEGAVDAGKASISADVDNRA
ncbi:PDZ domain-containing protein [Paenibacillus alvei]|uniref:PDZ domain-containing protein n=1 Tax=Paenibacillus alvei TaxID=44250 RepID=A0ABT4GSC9_PAEAL|nr:MULTISPECIES: PDZ domain-containing protein [Paenibacillus]MCY7485277.1 PDZ domain-containing protein [Paenibacillus alvei]MCY9759595.1 PDZ domain-containing protein [Paenibacillus alvei]MCY9766391.1 PDZ domain-containing protein [Paenibacillus alvei]